MLRVEPEIVANYVAAGNVSLSFHHVLDHGAASLLGSRAAECAGQQSALGFWQMHDLLFERQSQIWSANDETLVQWGSELGLDGDALRSCLADPAIADKVNRLDQARREQGVRLRPSFDLNGRLIEGALPYAQFTGLFDEALAQ